MKTDPVRFFIFFGTILIAAFCAPFAFAQSGGSYQITQSVTANGGETSSGGSYTVQDTNGQPVAGGPLQSSRFSIYSGFWTPPNLAPTAAGVNVSGRVRTAAGQGISNAVIVLTDSNGVIRSTRTATFGYFEFTDVRAGEIYVITISSRRFIFSDPVRILNVQDELREIDFIAEN